MRVTPTAIFAADPGLATGWASWDGTTIKSGTADPMEFCGILDEWCQWQSARGALVVLESYTITAQTIQKSQQTWSLELIGAAKWLAHKWCVDVAMQKPSEAKSLVPDSRLRQLDLWAPGGPDHERDALRHLVFALAKRRLIQLRPL